MSVAKVMGLALHQNRLQGIKVTEVAGGAGMAMRRSRS
jgi:hypothetical protein